MSVTVSDASSGYSKQPSMSKRPSSNILGRSYAPDGRRGSDHSAASHRLHPQTSNSTMRSHYDAKSSPLSISQQTSDSAVRDRALRRGHPPVLTEYGYNNDEANLMSPGTLPEPKERDSRKNKPARLDLSKLFPKPKPNGQHNGNPLLSPNKMVNSPAAMSMASDYFPRPMTREPTPQIGGHVKLTTTSRHQKPVMPSAPSSPVRAFRRDEYDNAKVNVRRPPKGVQHWFDALDEDSDETAEDEREPIHAPRAVRPNGPANVPMRKASLDRLLRHAGMSQQQQPSRSHYTTSQQPSRSQYTSSQPGHDTFSHEDIVDVGRLNSPSEYSVVTSHSLASTRTRESALSKSNLQDSSILSFSSSEEEEDVQAKARKFDVRKSIDSTADAGEVIIGQARAFEVRQQRRPSGGMRSTRTISTSAATIEVMYSPEPSFSSYHYPRNSVHSGSRRSSHVRQPSVIHEDEDSRPRTAFNMPLSPSSRSAHSVRTSVSEPQPNDSRKFMAVTAEEEALLELMRKKRADIAKYRSPQADKASPELGPQRKTQKDKSRASQHTSAFLTLEASPVRVEESKSIQKLSPNQQSPLLLPPRGRPTKSTHESNVSMSQLRDSSAGSAWSDRYDSPAARGRLPHYLPTPGGFSPLEPFPPSSPTPTASVTSPTDPDHPSPLPSPITPGLRVGETDVAVKVASSDTSNDTDDLAMLDNGVIGAPTERAKSGSSSREVSSHRRRRTASSGADVTFPAPPTNILRDLASVTEASSPPPSIIDMQFPKVPKKSSRRVDELAVSTSSRARQSSAHSTSSRTSAYSHTSSPHIGTEKRNPRLSRGSSVESSHRSARDSRNSVSDDVLAAWNSLGGTY